MLVYVVVYTILLRLDANPVVSTFIAFILAEVILILLTLVVLLRLLTQVLVISTTLLVIRVHLLMMLVCSTAHTFHYRWFVQLERTVSNQKLALRLVTES